MKQKMSNEKDAKKVNILRKTTLADVAVGQSCEIVECQLPPKVKARFAEMGLVPHTVVTVIRVAPLGDPIVIRARGYELCLRKETASQFSIVQKGSPVQGNLAKNEPDGLSNTPIL